MKSVEDVDLYLSVLTLGEIRNGTERLRGRDPDQAQVFDQWLARLELEFGGRILAIDQRVSDRWGHLNAERSRNTVERLIAATAHAHNLTVATRNIQDFEGCQIALVNPFEFSVG